MLNINFRLENHFGTKFKNLGSLSKKITKNKIWELQHCYDASTLLQIELNYSVWQDHAGLRLSLVLFGYTVCFQIYDSRHWDYVNCKWSTE